MRRRQLLPDGGRAPRPDVGVSPQGGARIVIRSTGMRGNVRRRRVPVAVRRLDRAARGGGRHRRVRGQQLLPLEPEHARADGGVPDEDVPPSLASGQLARSSTMPSSIRSLRRFFAGLAIGSAVCGCATAATFTVTTAADTGAGSLRQAIQSANANPGDDAIVFAIPGGGVQTISVASPLTITDSVEIQGYTQPGSNVNTDPDGDNAVLTVELQGAGTDGLVVTGGTARISGLVLHGFQNAINLDAIGGSLVAGCWVGLLPTGLSAPGNAVGIWVHGTAADAVGDGTLPNRNVVSGNGVGIQIDTSIGSTVQGNLI